MTEAQSPPYIHPGQHCQSNDDLAVKTSLSEEMLSIDSRENDVSKRHTICVIDEEDMDVVDGSCLIMKRTTSQV